MIDDLAAAMYCKSRFFRGGNQKYRLFHDMITLTLHLLTTRQTIDVYNPLRNGFEGVYNLLYLRMARNYVCRLYLHVQK